MRNPPYHDCPRCGSAGDNIDFEKNLIECCMQTERSCYVAVKAATFREAVAKWNALMPDEAERIHQANKARRWKGSQATEFSGEPA